MPCQSIACRPSRMPRLPGNRGATRSVKSMCLRQQGGDLRDRAAAGPGARKRSGLPLSVGAPRSPPSGARAPRVHGAHPRGRDDDEELGRQIAGAVSCCQRVTGGSAASSFGDGRASIPPRCRSPAAQRIRTSGSLLWRPVSQLIPEVYRQRQQERSGGHSRCVPSLVQSPERVDDAVD